MLDMVQQKEIESYIRENIEVCKEFGYDLMSLTFYVIKRNIGGTIYFKTIKNNIVQDKLDISYANSRDLLGLEQWNVKEIYKIKTVDGVNFEVDELEYDDIRGLVFNVVEPDILIYGVKSNGAYYLLKTGRDLLEGISYGILKESLDTFLRMQTDNKDLRAEKCYIIDYN